MPNRSSALSAFRLPTGTFTTATERVNDPLGRIVLTDEDFHELTRMMMDLASRYCEGRLVSPLEGGYDLDGLAWACEAHVRALAGI